jgi:hypothetical protein
VRTRRRFLHHGLPLLLAAAVARAAPAQSLEVRPEQAKATIGDPITLRITVSLPPGMELIDAVPHTLVPPPKGTRVLSADTLRPSGGGTFTGKARVAFYRVGQQPVPTLALLYRSQPGEPPDTLLHLPVSVEITPTLEPGNPPLKDIKPLQVIGGPIWGPLAILLSLIGGGFWWLQRRGRPRGKPTPTGLELAGGPYDLALARLAALEQSTRASGNGVVPLYAGVAELLRDCLLAVGAIPHHGLTSTEVARGLPPALAGGDLKRRCEAVLQDADLVKFAKVRPDFAAAEGQIARTRALLEGWKAASTLESGDAVR